MIDKIDVRDKLASVAGVSGKTYSMGKKILDSDNETLKQEVLSGEKSINAGYKELTQGKKKKSHQLMDVEVIEKRLQDNNK